MSVSWDGVLVTATGFGDVSVLDAAVITPAGTNPTAGQVTDAVTLAAALLDSDGGPIAGRLLTFAIGGASQSATTGADGSASATLTLVGPAGAVGLQVTFAGDPSYGATTAFASFTIEKETTTLTLTTAPAIRNASAQASATLREADGTAIGGAVVAFYAETQQRNVTTFTHIGSATTDASGVASYAVPSKYVSTKPRRIEARFAGDTNFLPSSAAGAVVRQ
jgi:hypothetical protein